MNRALIGLAIVVLGCSGGLTGGPNSEPEQVTAYDFQAAETMLELDRTAAPLAYAALKNAKHAEFRAFGDEIGHRAFQRTDKIAAWKRGSSAPSKIQFFPLPCSSGGLTAPASDVDLAKALVQHRECGIALAREVRKTSRIHEVQDLADAFIADYVREQEQLQTWISQWNRQS